MKKGLDKSAAAQAGSSAAQSANLESALASTVSGYQPYTSLGSNAAGAYADLLGIGGSTGEGQTSGPVNWESYLSNNPDVAAEWNRVDKTRFPTAEAFAQWHYDNYGRAEGRQVYEPGSGQVVSAQDAQARAIAGLEKSPLFTSMIRQGQEAINANASATGGLRGGNNIDRLTNFRSDTLANVIQNQLAGYQGAIGTGMNAQGGVTNAQYATTNGQNSAQQLSTDALIQKILGKAGINNQNWKNAGAFVDDAVGKTIGGGFNVGNIVKSIF